MEDKSKTKVPPKASDLREEALEFHRKQRGKIEVVSKVPCENAYDLTLSYTPGVAEPCKEIMKNKELVYEYTSKWNMVAIVSDGSRVLGLSNIGPEAALPVMEGKATLFKKFGGVDAFPICLATEDAEKIIETTKLLEPVFGGINLEDISTPKCFEIEKRLISEMSIPVFHDDQHGTATVTLAALLNALKLVGKKKEDVKIVINGAGAAGDAITRLLVRYGFGEIIVCDSKGIIHKGREKLEKHKMELAEITNPSGMEGSFSKAAKGADVLIGVSQPGTITKEDIASMNEEPIVFAMANPIPEIWPDDARKAGARIVAAGRSDLPNQVNNVLGFPGIFRGVLDVRARKINEEMKFAAAHAIASLVSDSELNELYIIPKAFDLRVAPEVAAAVGEAAVKTGVARLKKSREELKQSAVNLINRKYS